MIIPTVEEPASPVLRSAVDALDVAVEDLIKLVGDGHVRDLGAFELVATLQALERVRNKLPTGPGVDPVRH
jgi:hypothetical protein